MRSFDIDEWINQLPDKISQITDMLVQPVPIAIFFIFCVIVWKKLNLSKKFGSAFAKFLYLMRTVVIIGIVILVASFFQYMNSEKAPREERKQIAEEKNATIEPKKTSEFPAPKEKTPVFNEENSLFGKYIFLLPDELALQNAHIEKNYNEGLIAQENGLHKDAVKYFSKTISHATKYAFPYCARGIAHAKLGNYREALLDFDEAIFLDSSASEVFNNRAVVFAEQGQLQIALRDFNNAVFLSKSISQVYVNRGYLNYLLEDYEESIYDWKKAIYINNKHADQLDRWLQKAYDGK
ncbi:tetratricopeptide repeat protein [Candidatus Uabimicrobium sp. HlEnr_7]|uniref:tetratricopeptide repeat protein n=1 Tax=Candidatus Uabimicrobium helgolandensis TaxID=3095367 RepID=UPI003556DCB6